ncbi:hypothetical protein BJ165DRAFT_999652 [Panaeolus papilionaceus]|nr:hypothetical protein BJ165DRAFT_999652 [Panaeolus papilionaceus]
MLDFVSEVHFVLSASPAVFWSSFSRISLTPNLRRRQSYLVQSFVIFRLPVISQLFYVATVIRLCIWQLPPLLLFVSVSPSRRSDHSQPSSVAVVDVFFSLSHHRPRFWPSFVPQCHRRRPEPLFIVLEGESPLFEQKCREQEV